MLRYNIFEREKGGIVCIDDFLAGRGFVTPGWTSVAGRGFVTPSIMFGLRYNCFKTFRRGYKPHLAPAWIMIFLILPPPLLPRPQYSLVLSLSS